MSQIKNTFLNVFKVMYKGVTRLRLTCNIFSEKQGNSSRDLVFCLIVLNTS